MNIGMLVFGLVAIIGVILFIAGLKTPPGGGVLSDGLILMNLGAIVFAVSGVGVLFTWRWEAGIAGIIVAMLLIYAIWRYAIATAH